MVSFAQFTLRGLADPISAPGRVHLHGILMLAFIGTFSAQNLLAQGGNLALHRKLGWFGAALVAAIVLSAFYTFVMAMTSGRMGPQFTPHYFLALTILTTLAFAAMVAWAIARRRDTQWHRRLMICATILLLDPALGRLYYPLAGLTADVAITTSQLVVVGVIAWHDLKVLGRMHKATVASGIVVFGLRCTIYALSFVPPFAAYADRLVG